MESLVVECLRCGTVRRVRRTVHRRFETPECPNCGYLGWKPLLELTESKRPAPGGQPVDKKRDLPSVA